jgi:hypothetical protein
VNKKPPTVASGNSAKGNRPRQQPVVGGSPLSDALARALAGRAMATATAALAAAAAASKAYGPVVDGSFPPVFVQNPDGSLVLAEYL